MAKKKITIQELTVMGLLVALWSVMAQIAVILPVSAIPVTMGTFAVNLIALTLKPRQALMTAVVYLFIGAIGLPVFTGGGGGIAKFVSPTGGYLLSYLLVIPLLSYLKGHKNSPVRFSLITILAGIPLINLCGALHMALFSQISITEALIAAALPFIAGDIFKCIAASLTAAAVNKAMLVSGIKISS